MSRTNDPYEYWTRGAKRKRSRIRKLVSRYFGYFVLRALHAVISRLPLPAGLFLARVVGTASYYIRRRDRSIALLNLTRVYGAEKSPAEIRRLAREVFYNAAATIVEWVILGRWPKEKLLARYPEILPALDQLDRDAKSTGGGVVGVTGHCGNWEMLSIFLEHRAPGYLLPVARRAYFWKYNDFIHRLRTRCGCDVYYTDESPRKLIRAIREGHSPGFLPDVDLRTNSGVFVDFLGQPAYTTTFPVALARSLEVKMHVSLLLRDGKKYKLYDSGLLDVAHTEDEKADLLAATQLWTKLLDEQIRKHPEQWTWMHARWRTTPDKPRRIRPRKGKEGKEGKVE